LAKALAGNYSNCEALSVEGKAFFDNIVLHFTGTEYII